MRLAIGFILVVATALFVPRVYADESKTGEPTEKASPTDQQVADSVGDRISKVFARFGYPADVFASDAASANPSVFLDYGSYGFKVRNKVAISGFFFREYLGTVFGAKMGDTESDVIKRLGKPKKSDKGTDGFLFMIWSFKEWNGSLEINFDENGKMKRAVVSVN